MINDIRTSITRKYFVKNRVKTLTTPQAKSSKIKTLYIIAALTILTTSATTFSTSGHANADQFDAQIRQLQEQNNRTSAQNSQLRYEESDLQAVLNRIQGEIGSVVEQINVTNSKQAEIEIKISQAETELIKQRSVLGENIRIMHRESKMSNIEMLASSKNLSEYMDKEQYRTSVQRKITSALDEVKRLQAELDSENTKLEQTMKDLSRMQASLDTQRAEQNQLLSMNQEQQAAFEEDLASNNSKIADLRQQQIAANARFTQSTRPNVPDTTGYPWASHELSQGDIYDPWGMEKRQCVSYTAWKVYASGRHMPYWGGYGNANQWDDNAIAEGIPVDTNPRVGDVAVSNAGYYGHVMYVEAVYDDGSILVSQYNAGWDRNYSEAIVSTSGLVFIHF